MTPSLMKVYTSKLCTTMHVPKFELLDGGESQFFESPERREAIHRFLVEHPETFEITEQFDDFGKEPIQRVHAQDFIEYLESAFELWIAEGGHPNGVIPSTIPHKKLQIGRVKPKTSFAKAGEYCFDLSAVITKDTFKAAWNAAQITLTATKELLRLGTEYEKNMVDGAINRSHPPGLYALVRPPGHHAQSNLCGGYCYINNAAVSTQWIIDQSEKESGQAKKVAILDIDFHHGNGTQEIFYNVRNPLYTSLHSEDEYPHFTGSELEKGEGDGLGYNINIPLPKNTTDDEYIETLEKLIRESVVPYKPDYIIVSLGVDTYKEDPIAGFLVTSDAYPRMGEAIRKIGVPTLFIQEGGYCIEKLGINVGGVLRGYLGKA
ncbi:hypothetical protein BGW38_006407 [Lunasporangiospora selenospora]|uniref:Histone deacetylase domain-containing protein n=1 Tax=Lunasporangiospora selenospora TaxID=979761 RepID=A0A9P6FMP6_9FUNG|nr:hypothetical protein BGW38_006407 [Lunasporangiospora selenospora]